MPSQQTISCKKPTADYCLQTEFKESKTTSFIAVPAMQSGN